MSLEVMQIKNHLNEVTKKLKFIKNDKLFNSGYPTEDLIKMSIAISKIKEASEFSQLSFLAIGMNFFTFKNKILNPIKYYFQRFCNESITQHYLDLEGVEELLIIARSQLNVIICDIDEDNSIR